MVVGLIRTNASSQFAGSSPQRFVRSWFHDPGIGGLGLLTADRTPTNSGTYAEVHTEIRVEFLVWTGEVVIVQGTGSWQKNTGGGGFAALAFDGITAEAGSFNLTSTTAFAPLACALVKTGLTEGYHYATLVHRENDGNTTTFEGTTALEQCALKVYVGPHA
jgi:hypothetical protein